MDGPGKPQMFFPHANEAFRRLICGGDTTELDFMDPYKEIYVAVKDSSRDEVYKYVCGDLALHVESLVEQTGPDGLFALLVAMPRKRILDEIGAVCSSLHRYYVEPNGLEDLVTFTQRKLREAVVEKTQSCPILLRDWLRSALESVRLGIEPDDETKLAGGRLLEAFELDSDYYSTHFSLPFIRGAVAFYHEKAKQLISVENPAAFEEQKAETLQLESARAEVYLNEPHRSDYVTTLSEIIELGSEKFQRP